MKFSIKLLAVISALLLVSACETPGGGAGGANGAGGAGTGINPVTGEPYAAGSQGELESIGDRVFFGYDSSVLTSEGQATLDRQAAWLQKNGSVNVAIEGHCDERGTREYNIALGERRATAAKNYLVSLGVDSSRLRTISYGKERPAVLGSDDSSYAQNRRGVTVVE